MPQPPSSRTADVNARLAAAVEHVIARITDQWRLMSRFSLTVLWPVADNAGMDDTAARKWWVRGLYLAVSSPCSLAFWEELGPVFLWAGLAGTVTGLVMMWVWRRGWNAPVQVPAPRGAARQRQLRPPQPRRIRRPSVARTAVRIDITPLEGPIEDADSLRWWKEAYPHEAELLERALPEEPANGDHAAQLQLGQRLASQGHAGDAQFWFRWAAYFGYHDSPSPYDS